MADSDAVIDREELFDRLDNDVELLLELIDLFLEDYPQLLMDIGKAVETGDSEQLRKSAHTLKGSVGNFCAHAAYESALRLEQKGASAELDSAETEYAVLSREMGRVEAALKALSTEQA